MSAHSLDWSLPKVDDPTLQLWYSHVASQAGTTIPRTAFKRIYADAPVVFELPFGLVRLDPLRMGKYAQAHGFIWSKEVFRHLDTFRELIAFSFRMYNLQYILVVAPESATGIKRLLLKIGFEPMRKVDGDVHYECRR